MTYTPGDIAVVTGTGFWDRLIQTGQGLTASRKWKKWNHAIVIVTPGGGTVEAEAKGVVYDDMANHPDPLILPCPAGVDRNKVVAFASSKVGAGYDFFDDVLMGLDCLALGHLKLHEHGSGWICSELAAAALVAGGWRSPKDPAAMMPSDLAMALSPV
ncbi:MAG: hypothetical protein M3Y91_15425 [Actinomycetota bacterium]|nr:hypothetical protein [Actinomycetota bacterium]